MDVQTGTILKAIALLQGEGKGKKTVKKRKPAGELTSKGLARRLFPREVRREIDKELAEKPKRARKVSTIKAEDTE